MGVHIMHTEQDVSSVLSAPFAPSEVIIVSLIACVIAYLFPNDKLEQERQLLESAALTKLVDGRLFFAPLSQTHPPRSILDVATGTGDWAIQMGDLFPTTNIVATDLSPIQPDHVPPNVNFYIEDS